jgi:hypothetical protein
MSFRDDSKGNWTSTGTVESINAGSLQRIADATEKMAGSYIALQADRDRYKKWYEERGEVVAQRNATIAGLRGHNTRLKNQLAKLQQEQAS